MSALFRQTGPPDADDGLVRRLKWGAPGAFDELLEQYQGPIYGFVYRLLDDPSDAADVTQEVFLKVFRKIDDFRADCTLKTWIYRIAVHEASNRRRWFSRHRRRELPVEHALESGSKTWHWLADPRDTPFEAVSRQEQRDLIDEVLRGLDERLRVAVVLRDVQGLSYNEIAATLQISLGTVKSRILRGREALRERLARRLAGEALEGFSLQTE